MKKYIKLLKWLLENQEKLEEIIKLEATMKEPKKNNERGYSLAGVPKNQLKDIDDILKDDSVL